MLKVKKNDLRRALALNTSAAKELETTIQEFRKLQVLEIYYFNLHYQLPITFMAGDAGIYFQ